MEIITLIGIMFGISLVSVIVLLFFLFKKEEIDTDMPIVLNFMSEKADGRAFGTYLNAENGKGFRNILNFIPRDVSKEEIKKGKIKNSKVIVQGNKMLFIPKGLWSKERSFVIILPNKIEDIKSGFRDTLFGKALMYATTLRDLENTHVRLLEEGRERRDDLLKKIGDGEISREFMASIEEMTKDFMKATILAREKKDPPSTFTPRPGMEPATS